MTDKPDISYLAALAYAGGADPITHAEQHAAMQVEVWANVLLREHHGRERLPAWQDVSKEAMARKLIGDLLDAGWTPPAPELIDAATRWVADEQEGAAS